MMPCRCLGRRTKQPSLSAAPWRPPSRALTLSLPLASGPWPCSLLLLVTFNVHPDYTTLEGWEGTVEELAGFCCCRRTLAAADEAHQQRSKEETL